MTPAEQLVMAIDSPVLDGLGAQDRLAVACLRNADKAYTSLSEGERHIMRMADEIDTITRTLPFVDDLWRDRIGDALARTAATAWSGVSS